MVRVIEEQGSCLIAKNYRVRETSGSTGTGSTSPGDAQSPFAYDGFWSGDRWVHQRGMAMRFETRERAVQYLGKNERQM